jgi:hypothetical protein
VALADKAWAIRGMWAQVVDVGNVRDGGQGKGTRTNMYNLRMRGNLSDKIMTVAWAGHHTHSWDEYKEGEVGSGLDVALVPLAELISKASHSSHLTLLSCCQPCLPTSP